MAEPVPIRRDISLKLSGIARHLRKNFDARMEGFGITRSQWSVIVIAARRPGVTQRALAEFLDMSESAAGRLVDRLCADGLLERRPKEDDRRAHSLHLTDAATPLLEKIGALAILHEQQIFADMPEADLAKLAELLDAIYRNVSA